MIYLYCIEVYRGFGRIFRYISGSCVGPLLICLPKRMYFRLIPQIDATVELEESVQVFCPYKDLASDFQRRHQVLRLGAGGLGTDYFSHRL